MRRRVGKNRGEKTAFFFANREENCAKNIPKNISDFSMWSLLLLPQDASSRRISTGSRRTPAHTAPTIHVLKTEWGLEWHGSRTPARTAPAIHVVKAA